MATCGREMCVVRLCLESRKTHAPANFLWNLSLGKPVDLLLFGTKKGGAGYTEGGPIKLARSGQKL